MDIFLLKVSLLEPLYILFGWLTRIFFDFFGNYGLAIIALTVLVRGCLIPLNVKSQKSMIKMQALSGKTAELQRKYGDDKQRYQEEVMKLQQENGLMGGLSGCLLPFLQLFFIWPIYRIVSGPLIYISQVSKENIDAMIELAKAQGLVEGARAITTEIHISLMEILNNNSDFLRQCISKGYVTMGQMVDLNFLGMDLTKTPAWNPLTIIKAPGVYLPLLIFPILVVITNILSMKLTTALRPGYKEQQEAKERAKVNPARSGQQADDPTEASMKMMNWMMPIIMLITTFTLPAAMGLYWVVGGIMGIITQLIVYFMFTKPYELKKLELEEKKANAFKKNSENNSSKKNGKKKK